VFLAKNKLKELHIYWFGCDWNLCCGIVCWMWSIKGHVLWIHHETNWIITHV